MSVKDNKSDLTRLARFDPEYWFLRSAGRAKPGQENVYRRKRSITNPCRRRDSACVELKIQADASMRLNIDSQDASQYSRSMSR